MLITYYALINLTSSSSFHVGSNLYIADRYNQRIRKVVISTGIISTVAGTGTASFSGDNGLALSATFNSPLQVALDASGTVYIHPVTQFALLISCLYLIGNVYITDNNNNRLRKVTMSTGIITTIAGSGSPGSTSGSFSGDGDAATAATLNGPYGVAVDSSGIFLTH